jgi:hypothetical protein
MWGRGIAVLLGLALAACTGSAPNLAIPSEPTGPLVSAEPTSATDEGGTFRLTIASDQDRYRAGQPMLVTATLTYLGPADAITAAGSGTLVGFGVGSTDAGIDVEPIFTGDCATDSFTRDDPVAYPFVKSGAGASDDGTAWFIDAYFSSPELRLPAGTWTIRAETTIYPNPECSGTPDSLSASLTVVIEP